MRGFVSKNDKKIPLSVEDDEPHNCRPFIIPCRNCGCKITFDDEILSKSGKKIPLLASSHDPHNCTTDKMMEELRK
ncbi:MAG: hypothetical protein WCF23_16535 [Candidatus Nitrosopolaris sp.]